MGEETDCRVCLYFVNFTVKTTSTKALKQEIFNKKTMVRPFFQGRFSATFFQALFFISAVGQMGVREKVLYIWLIYAFFEFDLGNPA